MKVTNDYSKPLKVAELEDVLNAKVLDNDVTIEDWPFGRQKRCSMRFYIEKSRNGQKERLVRQSTYKGRTNKPKKDTYCLKCVLLEIEGMTCHLHFNEYAMARLTFENSNYMTVHFEPKDTAVLAKKFM